MSSSEDMTIIPCWSSLYDTSEYVDVTRVELLLSASWADGICAPIVVSSPMTTSGVPDANLGAFVGSKSC